MVSTSIGGAQIGFDCNDLMVATGMPFSAEPTSLDSGFNGPVDATWIRSAHQIGFG